MWRVGPCDASGRADPAVLTRFSPPPLPSSQLHAAKQDKKEEADKSERSAKGGIRLMRRKGSCSF